MDHQNIQIRQLYGLHVIITMDYRRKGMERTPGLPSNTDYMDTNYEVSTEYTTARPE